MNVTSPGHAPNPAAMNRTSRQGHVKTSTTTSFGSNANQQQRGVDTGQAQFGAKQAKTASVGVGSS